MLYCVVLLAVLHCGLLLAGQYCLWLELGAVLCYLLCCLLCCNVV